MSEHLRAMWRRVAMPTSWRPFTTDDPTRAGDAVIITDPHDTRNRIFEVWTYGILMGTYHRLEEAKGALEAIYGPLTWRRVRAEPVEIDTHAWGPTTEFTNPTTYYVVDTLPVLGVLAFRQNLDWRVTETRSNGYQVVEAVYLGIRFVLEGLDSYLESSNWGPDRRGGWTLSILEPGDRVQIGLPWNHRVQEHEDTYPTTVKWSFNTLEEGKSYIEDVLVGKGVIDEMVPRDSFPEGSTRYHLTLARNVPAILSQGLHPRSQVGTGTSVFSKMRDAVTILWDLKNEDWAAYQGEPLALLELDVSGMLRSTIKQLSNEERVNEDIPPQRIRVVVDNIPWYLTDSGFSSLSLTDRETLDLLRGDPAVTRKAWTSQPERLDELVSS